jgi:von Willebrand factor type A domain
MNRVEIRWSDWRRLVAPIVVLSMVIGLAGCSTSQAPAIKPAQPAKGGPGSIGVVILIDTSGSMKDPVPDKDGKKRPKNELANEALAEILRQTADWTGGHPDKPLNLAISTFADYSNPVLAMGQFDNAAAQAAVKAIPLPNGGTGIGRALRDGWDALKPVHCERQYILCITDGQNTQGTHPRDVVPGIHKESDGKVEIHFIAFDVDGKLFDFATPYNGHVESAANKEQLEAELTKIFQKRILLEQQ